MRTPTTVHVSISYSSLFQNVLVTCKVPFLLEVKLYTVQYYNVQSSTLLPQAAGTVSGGAGARERSACGLILSCLTAHYSTMHAIVIVISATVIQ